MTLAQTSQKTAKARRGINLNHCSERQPNNFFVYYYTMNPLFGSKGLLAKFWLLSTLCLALCLANPVLDEDSEVFYFFMSKES